MRQNFSLARRASGELYSLCHRKCRCVERIVSDKVCWNIPIFSDKYPLAYNIYSSVLVCLQIIDSPSERREFPAEAAPPVWFFQSHNKCSKMEDFTGLMDKMKEADAVKNRGKKILLKTELLWWTLLRNDRSIWHLLQVRKGFSDIFICILLTKQLPILSCIIVHFSRFRLDIKKKTFYCEGGEALAHTAQGSCGCPSLGVSWPGWMGLWAAWAVWICVYLGFQV